MEISKTRTTLGPSVHAAVPVLFHRLADVEAWLQSASLPDAIATLLENLPGLEAHAEACGALTGLTTPDASDTASLPHLFEHVCIELQRQAGAQLGCVRNDSERFQRAAGPFGAVVPYEEAEVGEAAAQLALDLLNHVAGIKDEVPASEDPERPGPEAFDFPARRDEFLTYAVRNMLPVQDRLLLRTAQALDIPSIRLVGRIMQLGQGRHQQRLSATKTSHTNIVSNDLAANKDYARRLLDDLGLPVPRSERVYQRRKIAAAVKRVGGYPVVVKPNNGSMGGGVSVGMKNRAEALAAYDRARKVARSVLVEEVVEGSDYRMIVINGKLCAASERVPGHVVGDGEQTIEALVAEVNRDPRRGSGPTQSWTRLELDEQAERLLAELGYDLHSIPPAGEIVFLRRNANTSDGGTAVDVTDIVHPDNRDIAIRAAKAIGLDIAGVDFLTKDISTSMWKNGGKICEINSRPGLRKHIWPHQGVPRDVMTPIIDMLFPSGQPSRIPVVAVTGTGDTRTAARMLEHVLSAAGHHVGLMLNRRVYSGGQRTSRRRMKPSEAMRAIFLDPTVDVAVFELSPADVRRHGVACDAIDVTAVIDAPVDATATDAHDPVEAARTADAIEVVTQLTRKAIYLDTSGPSRNDGDPSSSMVWRVDPDGGDLEPSARNGRTQRVAIESNAISIYDGSQVKAKIPIFDPRAGLDQGASSQDAKRLRRAGVFASLCAVGLGTDPRHVFRSLCSYSDTKARAMTERSSRRDRPATD